jgi:hypothetical protein
MSGAFEPQRHQPRPSTAALVIILAAFALLVYHLGETSLWADEARTVEWVERLDQGGFGSLVKQSISHPLSHPPLYFISLWVWTSLAGDSELMLRFPSVLFGTLAIAMVYPLATKLVARRVGLMAIALTAISPFLVMYSRTARPYSSALFFALVSSWFFSQLVVGPPTPRRWLSYIISSTVLMYTEYVVAFVLAAQTIVALARMRHNRRFVVDLLIAQLVVLLLFVPWLPFTMRLAGQLQSGPVALSGSNVMHWGLSLVHPFFAWIVGETIYPWNAAAVIGVILGLALAGRGLLSKTKIAIVGEGEAASQEVAEPGVGDGRLGWANLPIGTSWGTLDLTVPVFVLLPLSLTIVINRCMLSGKTFMDVANKAIVCAPFVYLLIAAGIWSICGRGRRLFVVVVVAVVLGLSLTNYYLGHEFHNPNQTLPTKVMAHEIVQQAAPDDVFVSDATVGFDYYVFKEDPEAVHFFAEHAHRAMDYVQQHQRPAVWVILLCRTVESESAATAQLIPWLLDEGYSLDLRYRYAPLDCTYGRLQELLLSRPACEHKITVTRYAPFP